MDEIFTNIAKNLTPDQRAVLEIFRTAVPGRPLAAERNELPMGYLKLAGVTPDCEPRWELSDLGRKVAEAAATLNAEENAA